MAKRVRLPGNGRERLSEFGGSGKGLKSHCLTLNEDVIESFADLMRQGGSFDNVAGKLRVGRSTARRWMQCGEMFEEGNGHPKDYVIYAAFRQEVLHAKCSYYVELETEDLRATGDSRKISALARRAIAILERRDRDTWGRVERDQSMADDYDPDMRYL